MIKLNINGADYSFPRGITLEELIDELGPEDADIIVAAIINNRIYELDKSVNNNARVEFLTRSDVLGNRIYRRSLFLLMAKAIYDLFPGARLSIEHSLGNGIYCELYKNRGVMEEGDLKKIYTFMKKLVKRNLPIKRHKMTREEAVNKYKELGFYDRIEVLKNSSRDSIVLYEIDDYYDYFYYHLVPRTGYLDQFSFHYNYPGFVLLFPGKENPEQVPDFKNQPRLAKVFMEYERLGEILGVTSVSELNEFVKQDKFGELIRIAEALHEKNVARIADKIYENIENKQIILIAGPSSSGKTTFTRRLSTQLKVNGLRPVSISVDDYFVNREHTPRDSNGNYNFEALEAVDLDLFNSHLIKLLQNEKVEIPSFNFQTGSREYHGRYLQLDADQPVLIEGIHGLNDRLTRVIPKEYKYKIYVSALTQLNIDRHNRIPTTDTRVLRRIIRDHNYRWHTAEATLARWPSVREGEEKNIFPYQENADIMFNSALIYELGVLKKYAAPLLRKIDSSSKIYYEAKRLLEVLSCFREIPDSDVPNTSILREFIGGSVFR